MNRYPPLAAGLLILVSLFVAACAPAESTYATPTPEPTSTSPSASLTPSPPATASVLPTVSAESTAVIIPGPGTSPNPDTIIEVRSGAFKKTVAPNQTTAMPIGGGILYAVIYYPSAISPDARLNLISQVVQPLTGDWQVQVENPPADNIYYFSVHGNAVPGLFTVQVSGGPSLPSIRFGVETTQEAEVTLADDQQTVTINNGSSFILKLGEDYTWTISINEPSVISREANITAVQGTQGVFKARRPGKSVLLAEGEPLCRQAHPTCALPSRAFHVNIHVLATG